MVRRVKDQVDSSRDKCGRVRRSNTLVFSAPRLHVVPNLGKRGQIRLPTRSLIMSMRRYITDEFSNASSHSTHCRVIVMSTIHRFRFPRLLHCHIHQSSLQVFIEVLVRHVPDEFDTGIPRCPLNPSESSPRFLLRFVMHNRKIPCSIGQSNGPPYISSGLRISRILRALGLLSVSFVVHGVLPESTSIGFPCVACHRDRSFALT